MISILLMLAAWESPLRQEASASQEREVRTLPDNIGTPQRPVYAWSSKKLRRPVARDRLSRKPAPLTPPPQWISSVDYPAEALRTGVSGRLSFTLYVDEDGVARQCAITASSGSTLLDAAACYLLLKRARFTAPLDRRGERVPTTWPSNFNWVLP